MAEARLVIIGGGAAGMSAAAKAKRTNPNLEVVAFEKSGFVSYGTCGLPYFVGGIVPSYTDLIVRTPEQFAKQGIQALTHHAIQGIDLAGQTVCVHSLDTGRTYAQPFDKLIVTSGGAASQLPVPGIDLPGVFTLRTLEDAFAVKAWIAWLGNAQPRRAVIVGAGYIGLEMAEAFHAQGLDVTVVEMQPQVMPGLDPDMAGLVLDELLRQKVEVYLEHRLEGFDGDTRVRAVRAGGVNLPADLVLIAIGGRPNVTLAREAGVALGPTGAIAVTTRSETNVPNVYAAGGVAEVHHLVTGKPTYFPRATTANKQGRVAGENAAGGHAEVDGIVGTAIAKVFDLEVGQTGLTEAEAGRLGFKAESVKIEHAAIAGYMPGNASLHVKIVWEQGTGRLLGAQIIGSRGAAKRTDVVATALRMRATLDDLGQLDLAYAPPFAPVWDPLLIAANAARR